MSELFLIAHKVRGEPAFDIAIKMTCPTCDATNDHCPQCDGAGNWWIIPTSGHRAFPWWTHPLDGLGRYSDIGFWPNPIVDDMPPDLRDHYTTEREAAKDLIKVLGLIHKPLASAPIKRRF